MASMVDHVDFERTHSLDGEPVSWLPEWEHENVSNSKGTGPSEEALDPGTGLPSTAF